MTGEAKIYDVDLRREQRMVHQDYIIVLAMDIKKDKHRMLIVDDDQAKIVRNIFNCYLEGYSMVGL